MVQRMPNTGTHPNRNQQFRQLLHSPSLEFLIEAHNGISARIGEEAGFGGIWASGLCLSAQFGVRDNNEASWTQVLEMLEFMADATSIPIMLDGDTGYGNFNNMQRLVQKLEQRNVSAVCIEDKLFPKTNSFIQSRGQPLADIDEFCGKIKAGKDAQRDDDFCIVARVEALIAGWGLDEALRRAEAYHAAGADAILIHSAMTAPDEVLAFKQAWGDRAPVVIVPTKYYRTPTDIFRDHGFSIAIWANHMLRSAVAAMQRTAEKLAREQNLLAIEEDVASVTELFRLQGASELSAAEARYLPARGAGLQAIVLAASRGSDLGELTEDKPKAMIDVRGRPLLSHIVSTYNAVGITSIGVVCGYCSDAVNIPGIERIDNPDYASNGELHSLQCALQALEGIHGLVISYGDVLFKKYILEALAEADDDFVIAVDANWRDSVNRDRIADYVGCSIPNSKRAFYNPVYLTRFAEDLAADKTHGEWMGLLKVSAAATPRLREAINEIMETDSGSTAKMMHLFEALLERGEKVRVLYSTGHWLDVDSIEDVVAAGSFE